MLNMENFRKFMLDAKEKELDVAIELTVPGSEESEFIIVKNANIDNKLDYYEKKLTKKLKVKRGKGACVKSVRMCNYKHVISMEDCETDCTERIIINKLIETYGPKNQLGQAVEEMAELTVELMKNIFRNKENRDKIVEETSDVLFLIKQIKVILEITPEEIKTVEREKFEKIMLMLEGEK